VPSSTLMLKIMGDEELQRMLTTGIQQFPQVLLKLGWASAYTLERHMKAGYSEGPLFARAASAGLEGATHGYSELRGGQLEAGSAVNKFYALVQETGAVIRAKNAKVLHFVNQKTGDEVFTKEVTIPAREPARKAAEAAEPEVRAIWEKGLARFVGGE